MNELQSSMFDLIKNCQENLKTFKVDRFFKRNYLFFVIDSYCIILLQQRNI